MKKRNIIASAIGLAFVIVGAIIGIVAWRRRPVVTFENIDWLNKTVTYNISKGKLKKSGTKNLSDAGIDVGILGNYKAIIKPVGTSIILAIADLEDKAVKAIKIDFANQTYTDIEKGKTI